MFICKTLSQRIYDNLRMCEALQAQHIKDRADMEYLAMMSDIDLDEDEEEKENVEEV